MVSPGETGISKLPDKLAPLFPDDDKYLFFFTKGMKIALNQQNTALIKLLSTPEVVGEKITVDGPMGAGKSFFLQYFVRSLRATGWYRVLYLPSPSIFFPSFGHVYYMVVLEIVFAFADDFHREGAEELLQTLVKGYSYLHSGGEEYPSVEAAIKTCLSTAKTYAERLGTSFIIVLDQENAFGRLLPADPLYSTHCAVHSLLVADQECAHQVITSTSMTSETLLQTSHGIYFNFCQALCDDDISGLVEASESFRPSSLASVDTEVSMLISHVGRWPKEVIKVFNQSISMDTGLIYEASRYESSLKDPNLEELIELHSVWFDRTLKTEEDKDFFLALLSIADECPPISEVGYASMEEQSEVPRAASSSTTSVDGPRIKNLLRSELHKMQAMNLSQAEIMERLFALSIANTPSSERIEVERADDTSREYMSIFTLTGHSVLSKLSKPQAASKYLDQRFFCIDRDGYVRATFPKILSAIRAFHQKTAMSKAKGHNPHLGRGAQ